jgi:glycosyltransferase involved in cell wall biosynthesis
MLNYASFFVSAVLRGLTLDRPDVIIGTSPQPLAAAAARLLALRFSCPFVFEVGTSGPSRCPRWDRRPRSPGCIGRLEQSPARSTCAADLIVPVTDAFVPTIKQYVPNPRLAVVENGVDLDRFQPPANRPELRRTLGLDKRFVVSYIGTIGMAHGLETLLDAAAMLKTRLADALVLVAGEGAGARTD